MYVPYTSTFLIISKIIFLSSFMFLYIRGKNNKLPFDCLYAIFLKYCLIFWCNTPNQLWAMNDFWNYNFKANRLDISLIDCKHHHYTSLLSILFFIILSYIRIYSLPYIFWLSNNLSNFLCSKDWNYDSEQTLKFMFIHYITLL